MCRYHGPQKGQLQPTLSLHLYIGQRKQTEAIRCAVHVLLPVAFLSEQDLHFLGLAKDMQKVYQGYVGMQASTNSLQYSTENSNVEVATPKFCR